MFKKLNALQPISYAALRIMAGLLYFEHGTQKLLNFPIPGPGALNTLQMASGLLELIGGALIVLGLFTRPVAFVLSGHMAFAYFMAHAPQGFYPVENGGDASILFCFVFLLIATMGAGKYALDNRNG